MQSEKASEDILELGTEMDIKHTLIEWYMHVFHRLVQRKCGAGMIQTTGLVHHMLTSIESRGDLVSLTIVHRPHRSNHRTEVNKLHRRRKMNRLVRTVFVSDSCMTPRQIRKLGNLQIAPDNLLDCRMSIVESERGFERLFPIWETTTRKVDPFFLAKFFDEPRDTRFLSIYAREYGKAVDVLTNVVQFHTYGKHFVLASSFGLTNGNEIFLFRCRTRLIAPSDTNEGDQSWGVGRDVEIRQIPLALPMRTSIVQGQCRELGGGRPLDAWLRWMCHLEAVDNGRNKLIPKFVQEGHEVSRHVVPLSAYSQGMEFLS